MVHHLPGPEAKLRVAIMSEEFWKNSEDLKISRYLQTVQAPLNREHLVAAAGEVPLLGCASGSVSLQFAEVINRQRQCPI